MAQLLNYADKPEYVEQVKFLIDIYEDTRLNRKWLEDEWERWENIWKLKRDYYKYEPVLSEVYIPIVRKKTEDAVNDISNKLFPFGDNFMIYAMPNTPEAYADAVKKLLQYQFFEEMKVPVYIKVFLRELLVKGTAVMKIYFENDELKLKTLDLKNDFYVYPSTADNVDDALITFEKMIVDKYELERMAEIGKYKNIDKLDIVTDGDMPEKLSSARYVKQYPELPYYEIIEVYTNMKLGDDQTDIPYIISFSPKTKTILQITPSPYVIEKEDGYSSFKPYLSLPFIKLPDSFYGASLYSQVQYLQYMVNDIANLMLDNAIFVQNSIVKVDPARVTNIDSLVFAPRAMWQCEPDAVIFDRPPSLLGEGIAIFQNLKLLTEEYGNIGGFMPVTTKRNTATEVALYSQAMTTFIQTIVADIEMQFLTPLLQKAFYLDQLFLSRKKLQKILGAMAFNLNIKGKETRILKKEYGFRWVGTLQSMNIYIKNQQLMNFMQVLAQLPREKVNINWNYVIKQLWKTLGNTDIDSIVVEQENQESRDPVEENELLSSGKSLEVSFLDDDIQHMATHNQASVDFQESEPTIYALFVAHVRKHLKQLQQKQLLNQKLQEMQGQNTNINQQVNNPITGGTNE